MLQSSHSVALRFTLIMTHPLTRLSEWYRYYSIKLAGIMVPVKKVWTVDGKRVLDDSLYIASNL